MANGEWNRSATYRSLDSLGSVAEHLWWFGGSPNVVSCMQARGILDDYCSSLLLVVLPYS